MGIWGPGIFSDDTAADARDDWLDLVRQGAAPAEASHRVISSFGGDEEASSIATLAVASLAWKHGRLDSKTRDRALEIIRSESDLARWADAGQGLLRRRRATLERLRQQLESPIAAPSHLGPRPQRRPEFPAGCVIEVQFGPGRIGVCRVYHSPSRSGPFCSIEPLAWTGPVAPSVTEMKSLTPVAVEPGVPTVAGSSFRQDVGPHRCLLILRQAERKDSRLRVIARDVFANNVVEREPDHGSMTVDSWIRHLEELYQTGTWRGVRKTLGAPPEPPGS